jgi:hypothetical protein
MSTRRRLALYAASALNAAVGGAMLVHGHPTLGMLTMALPGLGIAGAVRVLRRVAKEECR